MKRSSVGVANCSEIPNKVILLNSNIGEQQMALVDVNKMDKFAKEGITELAMEIERADDNIKSHACSKLQIIVDQIKFLQEQARNILVEAQTNKRLNHEPCNFVKIPGHVYHLYQKHTGENYFSMLTPEEWGSSCPSPQTYQGSFKLEHDSTWTPLSEVLSKEKQFAVVNQIFHSTDKPETFMQSIGFNS